MLVDITQIPYEEIKPNSILVVRLPSGFVFSDETMDMVDDLTRRLREKTDDSVSVLLMRHGTDIFHLSEELMNSGGWYRSGPNAQKTEDQKH